MSVSIKEVMIKDIVSLPLNKTLLDAANEMNTHSIGSIVILDTFSKPIGLITPFDVIEHMLNKRDINEILLKSFEKPLIVVNENDKVTAAAIKFLKYNIHHLAVTNNNGDLVGVISTYDLAKVIVN
ncbi:MAG: Inosine-5'-monophosphate dehydrogenase [Candidatus Heimdallarchaeota archaeon LC_3]|nr:MAG: Inosine-5'-monophosphate dehydrogenase [Candidatus Heimdallarchaeota archaeon LC_3]